MTPPDPEEADDPAVRAVDLLAPAFAAAGLDELEVEVGEIRVRLARPRPTHVAASPAAVASATPGVEGTTPYGAPRPGMRFVTAPLTGVWYAAPSPGARPYVSVGEEVAAGQVVGLIEAMKLFNEIKADAGGTVTRTLVEGGTLVKRQQPLLEIDPG
ncbi:MAG: acetyl-CoA carboxylase biotin carboxyl carrier protein [Candidatus Limnocylindria bacterium]